MRLLGRDQGLKIVLEGACLDPEVAAQVGYVDGVVAPDELLDQAVARADRLGRRLKFAVAAVKRAAYIGGSLASRPAGYPAFVMARPEKFDVGLLRSRMALGQPGAECVAGSPLGTTMQHCGSGLPRRGDVRMDLTAQSTICGVFGSGTSYATANRIADRMAW